MLTIVSFILFWLAIISSIKNPLWPYSIIVVSVLTIIQTNRAGRIGRYFEWVSILIYLLILPFGIKIKNLGFVLFSLGGVLNCIAILANNYSMPVDERICLKMGLVLPPGYKFIDSFTKFKLLCDWLYFPYAGQIFSIGDVLLYISFAVIWRYH